MLTKDVIKFSELLGKFAPLFDKEGYEVIGIEHYEKTDGYGRVVAGTEAFTIRILPHTAKKSEARG